MKTIDFLSKRKPAGVISVLLVLGSLIYIVAVGIPMGVDFEGGTKLTVAFQESDLEISTVRDAVTSTEPKATIVSETVPTGTQFSLKIKKPEVEEGKENEASLRRLRRLEEAFSSLNNEEAEVLQKLAAADATDLVQKVRLEDVFALTGSDSEKDAEYTRIAQGLKDNAGSAGSIRALAEAVDAARAEDLATAIATQLVPAVNHFTVDALNATLKRYDPLNRGADGEYSDIADYVMGVRAANGDFITSFDQLDFTQVAETEAAATLASFFSDNYIISHYRVVSNETFSPSIAAELLGRAQDAIILALIGILIYIGMRFDPNYAVASVVALAHDVIIALGVFAVAGVVLGVELSNPVIAAFLTIVGYSLNDTIVVFDRIRDNRADLKNPDLVKITNESINQTLSRTIVTSLTTFFVVAVIYFGSNNATLRDFAFPLLVGIIVGTYSSIFVASPTLLFMTEKRVLSKARAFIFRSKPQAA